MIKKILIFLCVLFFAVPSFSATYYVATKASAALNVADEGATAWSNSTSSGSPTSIGTAFARATTGDVVELRGGTYSLPQSTDGSNPGFHGILEPANGGTSGSPITYKAYTGETPILDGIAGGDSDPAWEATLIMTQDKSYITIDGLTFRSNGGTSSAIGRLFLGGEGSGGSGLIVKNCTFNGGSTAKTTSGDNAEAIRVQNTSGTLIQQNTIYDVDNVDGENHNTSAIKTYYTTDIIVDGNEIYNCTAGVYFKVSTDNPTVRHNYIHDCYIGVYQAHNGSTTDTIYYNNVISKSGYIGLQIIIDNDQTDTRNYIYNNTIYTSDNTGTYSFFDGTDGIGSTAVDHRFYNNIILGGQYKAVFPYPKAGLTECDYNQYGNSGTFSISANYGGGSTNYNSLAAWQATDWVNGAVPDAHGLASDPVFVNTSGTYSTLADFALQAGSPCIGTGKSGANMGADVTLVGPTGPLAASSSITGGTIIGGRIQ
jgi:parallel beta-helix repeat protein